MPGGLYIEGLNELVAALRVVDAELASAVRKGLREGGKIVEEQAKKDFVERADAKDAAYTAEHFRTYGRGETRVNVEQSLRKTTGLHPEWGSLQMTRGMLPALYEKGDEMAERVEKDIGELLHHHGF